jgi:periplasmic divalent cation tolerance protein
MRGRLVLLSTVGSAADAERIARALVEARLAACVNVVPGVVSHYRWQGKVQQDPELLLVIKTTRGRFAALRRALAALHPYEVPELLGLDVAVGDPPYLAWLDQAVAARPPRAPAPGPPAGRPRPRSQR